MNCHELIAILIISIYMLSFPCVIRKVVVRINNSVFHFTKRMFF